MTNNGQIHIRGGRLVDPANGVDAIRDIYIEDGRVVALGSAPKEFRAGTMIDAAGHIVCPGLIDLSVRMREPGQEYKATLKTECQAAVAGGVTTTCCPPDTTPIIDTPAMAQMLSQRGIETGLSKILPIAALTSGLEGEVLTDMHALHSAGAVAFSNAGKPVTNTMVMRRAMEYASSFNLLVILHAMDPWLTGEGCMHEGEVCTRLGLAGIPEAAETAIIARDLALIEQTGVRAHFAQLSCGRSIDMIMEARERGLNVSADVAIHHLHLTEYDVGKFNTFCRVSPPLRSERDRDRLRQAVQQGDIQAICSDHQPHESDAKLAAFSDAEPGISGVETMLSLTLKLVDQQIFDLNTLVERLSAGPARILGLPTGRLGIGDPADLCIFDPDADWQLDHHQMLSMGHNTPFKHWPMKGHVMHTIQSGKIVYSRN